MSVTGIGNLVPAGLEFVISFLLRRLHSACLSAWSAPPTVMYILFLWDIGKNARRQ
ncbi:MAG: hypothetical protein LBN74_07930 [Prevotella sp.]|nr:hypothetical protein [Prevotella sp.]